MDDSAMASFAVIKHELHLPFRYDSIIAGAVYNNTDIAILPGICYAGDAEKPPVPAVFQGFGANGDTELFEKASNINGFQGGRVANNLYISPFRATVFKTAALFLYLNSSVVIRVRKPLFFPL